MDNVNFQELCQCLSTKSILYVEDHQELAELTKEFLDFLFFQVDYAKDGKEALKMYENYFLTYDQHYDIVLTDINMPKMNGKILIKSIQEKNPVQKIAVLSSEDIRKLEKELCVDVILSKPLEFKKFITVFNNLIIKGE